MGGSSQSKPEDPSGTERETEFEISVEGDSIKLSKNFIDHLAVKAGINIDDEPNKLISEETENAANDRTYQPSNRELERLKFDLLIEQQKNKELKKVWPAEIEKVATEIESTLSTRVPQLVPVCEDSRNKVADCYINNPDTPLSCHSLVDEYKQCVRKARETATSTAGTSSDSPSS